MKKRRTVIVFVCIAVLLAAAVGVAARKPAGGSAPVARDNAANFGALLTDLVNAYETPTPRDGETIQADLDAIRSVSRKDQAVARAIAEHWSRVYLDPDYELYLYQGDDRAPELLDSGIPDSGTHAIVVLGYELRDGRMQPELEGRCDAAAAAARAFPSAILVCSGGATGENNPQGNTEAGLMKAYLVENGGIEASRIYTDERAMTTRENAENTFAILQENGIRTMTIVTSSYHQRWGQAVYNALAELYRRQHGYAVEIVGNYCFDTEPSVPLYRLDARIAARQIAELLELPEEAIGALPSLRAAPAGQDEPDAPPEGAAA